MVLLLSRTLKLWFIPLCATITLYAQESEIEITDFFAKVYLAPNEKSKFVGLAQRGERYPMIDHHETWVRIRFKNIIGWVYSSQVSPISASASPNPETPAIDSGAQDSKALPSDSQSTSVTTLADTQMAITGTVSSGEQSGQPVTLSPRNNQQSSVERKPKEEEIPKNWFSRKKLPELPSFQQEIEYDTVALFFQVVSGPARVMPYLDPKAPILGMAMKGEVLPLVGEGNSWCQVVYKDSIGWIEHRYGKIIRYNQGFSFADLDPIIYISAAVTFVIITVIIILVIVFRRKNSDIIITNVKKHVLMIAKIAKTIQYTLTDTNTSLERCFIEIGFTVTIAKDNQSIRDELSKSSPDVVLVDWKFDRNILTSLERLFATLHGSEKILFIIYNVPDPSIMRPSRILPNMSYLGNLFSDRDIFKIVTPLLVNENNRNMQKSVQSSALEGNIGEGNLLEVLQFIEIGRKGGCLLVETDQPFGLIYFNEGRIVYAATAQGILARDAIFAVLDLQFGKFRFVTNKRPRVTNVNLSTLEVLMEWTKAADEARKH